MIRSLVATLATGAIVAAGAQMPVQALPVQHHERAVHWKVWQLLIVVSAQVEQV